MRRAGLIKETERWGHWGAEGTENQVLSVVVWEMWDHGNSGGVAATGVMMITALLIVTLGLRALSFGRVATSS